MKQLFLFGIAALCTMLIMEGFIRTTHIENVSNTEFYKDIGRGRRKNLNFLYFNEGFGIGKINDYRYIGEANPPEKPKNTIRVGLVGDSFVEARQVFDRDYFGNIAENYLTKRYPDKRFEFLNFGMSASDIADMYAYQKTFVEKFNSDYILYIISKEDLEPNYSDPLKPKTIIKNDSLVISFDFKSSDLYIFEKTKFLTQNFIIFNMLNNCIKKTRETPLLAVFLEKIYTWIEPSPKDIKYQDDEPLPYHINPVTKRIIEALDPEKVIIINSDLSELPRETKNLCHDNDLVIMDLGEVLNKMKEDGTDPNKWEVTGKKGHWNPKAHKIIGKKIAEQMVKVFENE